MQWTPCSFWKTVLSEKTSSSILKSNIKNFLLKGSTKSHIGKIKGSNRTDKEYIDLSNMSHWKQLAVRWYLRQKEKIGYFYVGELAMVVQGGFQNNR